MRTDGLEIPVLIWRKLMDELLRRGEEQRESGAFLLGRRGSRTISNFVCYDDLDPTALDSGIVIFQGKAYVPLWKICEQNQTTVLADVHTHAGSWTMQSESDRTNPMIETKGHLALILPFFAKSIPDSLEGVGIFEYRGNHKWKRWNPRSGKILVR